MEQATPYHVLSELAAALMAIIVEPDRKGRIDMEEFSESMPTEVRQNDVSGQVRVNASGWYLGSRIIGLVGMA